MLIAFWAGSVFLAWAGLVGGWFVAKSKLSRIDQRIALDIQALDVAHELESDVLKDRYNDLLWKATGQSMYRQKREESLHAAEQIAADLRRYITTDQEREVSARIEREMNTLRKQSESGAPAPSQSEPLLANLLSAARVFDVQNETDLQKSLDAADDLDRNVTEWALALSLSTAGLLSAGSFSLVNRVVRPTLALTSSAQFRPGKSLGESSGTAR